MTVHTNFLTPSQRQALGMKWTNSLGQDLLYRRVSVSVDPGWIFSTLTSLFRPYCRVWKRLFVLSCLQSRSLEDLINHWLTYNDLPDELLSNIASILSPGVYQESFVRVSHSWLKVIHRVAPVWQGWIICSPLLMFCHVISTKETLFNLEYDAISHSLRLLSSDIIFK